MLPSVSYFTSASLARLDPSAKKDAPTPGGPLHCVLLTLVIVCFNRMVLLYFFFWLCWLLFYLWFLLFLLQKITFKFCLKFHLKFSCRCQRSITYYNGITFSKHLAPLIARNYNLRTENITDSLQIVCPILLIVVFYTCSASWYLSTSCHVLSLFFFFSVLYNCILSVVH